MPPIRLLQWKRDTSGLTPADLLSKCLDKKGRKRSPILGVTEPPGAEFVIVSLLKTAELHFRDERGLACPTCSEHTAVIFPELWLTLGDRQDNWYLIVTRDDPDTVYAFDKHDAQSPVYRCQERPPVMISELLGGNCYMYEQTDENKAVNWTSTNVTSNEDTRVGYVEPLRRAADGVNEALQHLERMQDTLNDSHQQNQQLSIAMGVDVGEVKMSESI